MSKQELIGAIEEHARWRGEYAIGKEKAIDLINKHIPDTPTPAKGEPMPQTRAYWEKRAESDAELILQMRDEQARLRQKINKLEQKKLRIPDDMVLVPRAQLKSWIVRGATGDGPETAQYNVMNISVHCLIKEIEALLQAQQIKGESDECCTKKQGL